MWTRGLFNEEYVPGLFAVSIDSYEQKRADSMWPMMCNVKTSAKSYEEESIRSGLGGLRDKAEGAKVTFDTQIPGPKQTWVHAVLALGVRITEEAIEDNLYELRGGGDGNLGELFHDLGESAEDTIETRMARFLNNGSATTYHTTRFGKALFATDHPRLDGSTFSNLATSSDLTYTTFWTNLIAAENQYNHRQQRITKRVKALWVPPQYEQKGTEILKSTDRPDTGNRAVNAYAASGRKVALRVWSQITDADAHYFQLDGKGIRYFWRRKTRFGKQADWLTGDMMVKVDQRWSAEIQDERDWYGVIPA